MEAGEGASAGGGRRGRGRGGGGGGQVQGLRFPLLAEITQVRSLHGGKDDCAFFFAAPSTKINKVREAYETMMKYLP